MRCSYRGLILFDIDGTLLRGTGNQHRDALLQGIEAVCGLALSFDGVSTAGRLDQDLIVEILRSGGQEGVDGIQLSAIQAAACRAYLNFGNGSLEQCHCPGVLPFLQKATAAGILLGIVTGNLQAIAQRKLERAGIWNYFAVGGFAEDGHTRAELAQHATSLARPQFGVSDIPVPVLIGDHLNDINAAHLNGYRSVAVATGMLPLSHLQRANPTVALPDLTHLDPLDLFPGSG